VLELQAQFALGFHSAFFYEAKDPNAYALWVSGNSRHDLVTQTVMLSSIALAKLETDFVAAKN
jgi:hypothetical protein